MTGERRASHLRRSAADRLIAIGWAPAMMLTSLHPPQGAAEYRYRFLVEAAEWARDFAQERWYVLVGVLLAIVLLWRSIRK